MHQVESGYPSTLVPSACRFGGAYGSRLLYGISRPGASLRTAPRAPHMHSPDPGAVRECVDGVV